MPEITWKKIWNLEGRKYKRTLRKGKINSRSAKVRCEFNDIVKISRKFKPQVQKENVNGVLKILTNNMSSDILPRWNTSVVRVKTSLCKRHLPTGDNIRTNTKIASNCIRWHRWRTNKKVAITTKGGPRGLDEDRGRKIIVSSCFGTATSNLRKAIPEHIKKLCITNISNNNNYAYLESLAGCRLILLNKNSVLRPIGVGEVLRRIWVKFEMIINKQDVMNAAG